MKPENVDQSIGTGSQISGKILFESKPINATKDDEILENSDQFKINYESNDPCNSDG